MKFSSSLHLSFALVLWTLPAAGQIFSNGGFESGLIGWSTNLSGGGLATFSTNSDLVHFGSRTLQISVTNAGTTSNSIRIISSSFNASSTNTYILRFWANTDVLGANLGVNLIGATPVYPQISFMLSTNSRAAGDTHYQE